MNNKFEIIEPEGVFGSDINFDVYPMDSKLNPEPCVYFISRLNKDSGGNLRHNMIYFGQTADISSCIKVYRNLKCFDCYHPNCVGIHHEEIEEERILIKSFLIKKYNPKLDKLDF